MKKKVLFFAVVTALALTLVLPNLGVMQMDCQNDQECPVGMTCIDFVCQPTGE